MMRRLWCAAGAAFLMFTAANAQMRFTYSSGQVVSPAYEGWRTEEDGSQTLVFGYMNQNWAEEFDIPIGPDNSIEPGGPDRGQPTHFYPRRSPFLFTIKVPKDFGDKELIWTVKTHGKIEKAYASLKNDYMIDNQVISTEVGGDFGSLRDELRTNIPPTLKVEGDNKRMAKVGAPMALTAIAKDPDNIPARRVATDIDDRDGVVSRTVIARAGQRTGPAAVVDRLPRQSGRRHVQPGADEGVDRHARLRQLAVVAAVLHPRAAAGQQVDHGGDVQGSGHLRAARRRQRRRGVHLRQRDSHGNAIARRL
jgi:hypothetical protein